MDFNEYIPQGGWLKFNARKQARASRRQALANVAAITALTTGFVAAYWLVAILELG